MRAFSLNPARDELLTSREAATLLRVHISAIYRWSQSGHLPYWRLAGRRVFKKSDLLKLSTPGLTIAERFPRLTTRREMRQAEKLTRDTIERVWGPKPQPAKPQ